MIPRFLSKVILLASLFVLGIRAQSDSAVAKCQPGWEWNQNSMGQDPCFLGGALDASCRGYVSYDYPPLNASQHYIPPRANDTGDQQCDCNTVLYILNMACASCQGASAGIYPWISWIVDCESVYVSQFPSDIPSGTAVPRWAYFNITTLPNQTYDDATAMRIGRDPEELPKPITTVSTGGSTSSLGESSAAPPGPSSNSDNGGSGGGTNVGAIVGGVVGTVVPLTILGVVVFFYMRRRGKKRAKQQQAQNPGGLNPYGQEQPSMGGPPVTSVPFIPYNPSDPSTFPVSSPDSNLYTTSTQNPRGLYSGIPEV